ncbi:hypothetical protein JCM9533A_78170 [Catenuloplanes niger JCM 9533]
MTGLTKTPHPPLENRATRAHPPRIRAMNSADARPVPETAATHPAAEIEDVLAECRDAGLVVDVAPHGPLWGWVRCSTGARSMTVRADPPDGARHACELRLFLNGHYMHHPRRKRGAR